MATTHTTSDPSSNETISVMCVLHSFIGLDRADVLADSQDIYWQYGDKVSGGFDAAKVQIVKAGMLAGIPRDPSTGPTQTWTITVSRRSADTVLCINGHNER